MINLEAMQEQYNQYMESLRHGFFKPRGWFRKRLESDETYFDALEKIISKSTSCTEVVESRQYRKYFQPSGLIIDVLLAMEHKRKTDMFRECTTPELAELIYDLDDSARNHAGILAYELGYYSPHPHERRMLRERFITDEYLGEVGVEKASQLGVERTTEFLIQLAITNTLDIISELRRNNVPKDKAIVCAENAVKKTYEEGREYLTIAMSPSVDVIAEERKEDNGRRTSTVDGKVFEDNCDTIKDSIDGTSPRVEIIANVSLKNYQAVVKMIEAHDYDTAQKRLDDIISTLTPPHGALFYQRAQAALGKGNTEAAKTDLDRALKTQFNDEYGIQQQDAYIALAEIHVSEGNIEEAFYVLEEGKNAGLDFSDKIKKMLAELQPDAEKTLMDEELPHVDDIGTIIEQTVDSTSSTITGPTPTTSKGTLYNNINNMSMYDDAIKIYLEQIKAEPLNPENHYNILNTLLPHYVSLPDNHRQVALDALDRAIACRSVDELTQMAQTYCREGKHNAAEVILGKLHWNNAGDNSLYATVIRERNSNNNPIVEMFAKYVARE